MNRGRHAVANFARRVLRTLNLPKNAAKPGWNDMGLDQMVGKLYEEYWELREELHKLERVNGYTTATEITEIKRRIAEEATDLGAVCMMVCDNVGGLDER
jgi:NTP pyrophosphatase (non-canonical NTP hydrolase)